MERFGPTRRGGPVFRWLGEPLALDLANTVMVVGDGQVDLIGSRGDLRRWLEAERERLGDCTFAVDHIEEVHELREAVRSLLTARIEEKPAPSPALEHLNAVSAAAPVAPALKRQRGDVLEREERVAGGDSVAQLLGCLARSAIVFLASPEAGRLHVCEAPSCGMFFVGARRWCCAACGNRARAARHYRRHRRTRLSIHLTPNAPAAPRSNRPGSSVRGSIDS